MNKENLKKWILLKKECETGISLYRVLELAEEILVIDCVKKTMPVWKGYEAFDDYEVVEENLNTNNLSALEDMDAESRRIAYQRYNIISGILPFIANEPMRTEAIKRIAEEKEISVQSIRKYLCEYLSSAIKDDGTFAMWTSWNETVQSLNYGHYNLESYADCEALFEEHYYRKK